MKAIRITTKQQNNKNNKPPPTIKYLYLEKKEGVVTGDPGACVVVPGVVVTGDPGAGVVVPGVPGVVVTGDPGAGVVVPGAGDPPPPCVCFASHVCDKEPTELIFAPDKSIF